MSKGAFNFNTQAVSSFELARRQEYKSEAEFLYYNAQIINNSTETQSKQQDPDIDFMDTRIRPIVKKVSDYTITVENFTIDGAGKNLPLFIPQIRQYAGNSTTVLNRNPNDTIYDITFTWSSSGTQLIQSTRSVQWEPENLATWASRPLPFGEYVGPQPEIPYYYCYTYSHWLKLVNATLACAWQDVKLAAAAKYPSVDFGTKCPFFKYNKEDNLFSLWQDSNTCATPYGSPVSTAPFRPTNPPNPLDVFGPSTAEGYSEGEFSFVGYNTNFEGLFTNFPTKYYGSGSLLSPSGLIVNNPLGNENCGVQLDPEVDTVSVAKYDGTAMTVTWDATPNPVPSSNWAFELPLESLTSVAAVTGSTASYTFTLTGNPVAQYLYAPLKIEGRSYSSTSPEGPTGTQTSSFQGTIVSYTQSTGALVINNLSNILPAGITGGVTGTNWKFELGPLTSISSVKPIEDVPLTLAVNLDPTQTLIYEGTAVDLIGSSGTVSGSVLSYELTLDYNGFTGADPQVDGFKYTSASAGPTGKFNPYVVYKAQDGVFQPGDIVEGSQTQATGKVIQVLAGNTNLPNTISINNLNGPFKVGDLVGLNGDAISGQGTILDISGPNEGTSDVKPTVRLTFSGQKNPFQINDIVYVGSPTAPIAKGKITDVIGPNTGYAKVSYTAQENSFGVRSYVVNNTELGAGEIISIEGPNTGYGTLTYINAQSTETGGAPQKYVAGEFLINRSTGDVFAQVVIDNTDVSNTTGNQGNITIRMLNPANWSGEGAPVGLPPFPGTANTILGSISGTIADFGNIAFNETGSFILGKINGTAWGVGNTIVSTFDTETAIAQVANFNYIDGGQLIIELEEGEFKVNDIIYGVLQSEPLLLVLEDVTVVNDWREGDRLEWPGGYTTINRIHEYTQGVLYLLINDIIGSNPLYNEVIVNADRRVQILNLSGVVGGFFPGDIINSSGGGTAIVNFANKGNTQLVLESLEGTFNPTNTISCQLGSTGRVVSYASNALRWRFGQDTRPAVNANYRIGNELFYLTENNYNKQDNGGFVTNVFGRTGVYLFPNQGTAGVTGGTIITRFQATPEDRTYNTDKVRIGTVRISNAAQLAVGDELYNDFGNVAYYDAHIFFPGGPGGLGLYQIFAYDCNFFFPVGDDKPIYVRNKPDIKITWNMSDAQRRCDTAVFEAIIDSNVVAIPSATIVSLDTSNPSTAIEVAIADSQPNAQVQTVYVDNPANVPDTILTVQNITGDFPIGTEIVDLGTGSGAQVTQTSFQDGLMIVQPINGTFETSDRMVGPDGSARFNEQIQQTLSGSSGSTATGTAAIKEDNGTYLTLTGVDGTFLTNGTFIITSPLETLYAGVTGLISQIPNFIVGKELWASGGVPGTNFAQAIVVSDTGSYGSAGTVVISNVQSGSTYGWRNGDYIRQYWSNTGATSGSYAVATISTVEHDFNLTILPYSTGVTGNSWQIKPSIATSSTLATPSVGGQSVLEMNLNDTEVVFYPGDTLKVIQYEPILPIGPIYLPENVVQVDLSAGNGVVETLKSIFPSSPDTGATYVVLAQDYESTSTLWSPVASIVLATTFIPVREEFSGQGIVLGTSNNGTQGNVTTASFQKVLLETPVDDITPQVGYRGMLKYERRTDIFSSLSLSNDDLSNLDIGIFWRNRLTNKLIPLTLFNGGSSNIRLMFKKISE
jgi:hypothetical protein